MRRFTSPLAICLLVAIAGCVVSVGSLKPLYTTKTAIDDDRIVGTWVEYDPIFNQYGNSTYVITENGRKAYSAIFKRKRDDSDVEMDLHLVAVGDLTFWDCHPKLAQDDDPRRMSNVRLHDFTRYELEDEKLRLFSCEVRKFERRLVSDRVPFFKKDNQIVITATTTELHRFLVKHGKELFSVDSPTFIYRKTDEEN